MNASSDPLFEQYPAPFSPAARRDPTQGSSALNGLVPVQGLTYLQRQIKRYACGEISGGAFLICGHRGAGKTTTVLGALQGAYTDAQRHSLDALAALRADGDAATTAHRPLLVRIHGPSLLFGVSQSAAIGDADKGASYALRLLQEMALGIVPALRDELATLLRARASLNADAQELIEHLVDRLGRGVSLAELRESYRRLGLLNGETYGLWGDRQLVRALQQITVLHDASEAYLVVSGTLETQDNSGNRWSQQRKSKFSFQLETERLLKVVAPLSATAVAWAGFATAHPVWGSALALAMLGSVLRYSSQGERTRQAEAVKSRAFREDNSHASLVRRVPLLIERLCAIGLPVVFLVDELDKIDAQVVDGMMENVKSYVTERSFICFVVEREYYERITLHQRSRPYPKHHTFFSDIVYVAASPAAYHRYLRQLMGEERHNLDGRAVSRLVFRLALLFRSQMHMYDLKRELAFAEALGSEALGLRASASDQALMQLCIEWVYSDPHQNERTQSDPYYAQMLNDVLYHPCVCWKRNEELSAPKVLNASIFVSDLRLLEKANQELLALLQGPKRLLEQFETSTSARQDRFLAAIGDQEGEREAYVERLREGVTGMNPFLGQAPFLSPEHGWTSNEERAASEFAGRTFTQQQLLSALATCHRQSLAALQGLTGYAWTVEEIWNAVAPDHSYAQFGSLWSAFEVQQTRGTKSDELSEKLRPYALGAEAICDAVGHYVCAIGLLAIMRRRHVGDALNTTFTVSARRWLAFCMDDYGVKARCDALERLLRGSKRAFAGTVASKLEFAFFADKVPAATLDERINLLASIEFEPRSPSADFVRWWSVISRMDLLNALVGGGIFKDNRGTHVLAWAAGWFPSALEHIWTLRVRPQFWPIVVYSDLMTETMSASEDEPEQFYAMLRALSAAQLGLHDALRQQLEVLRKEGEASTNERFFQWSEGQLGQRRELGVLLLSPGPSMSRWMPVAQCVVACVSDPMSIDDAKGNLLSERFALVIQEAGHLSALPARPNWLRKDQTFAVVVPSSGVARSSREGSTILLHAPETLEEALARLVEPSSGAQQ